MIKTKQYSKIKQVDQYKCELKAFKEIIGHDDSLPYIAKLYINGKYVCQVMNDGWGGMSFIREMNNKSLYDEFNSFIKDIVAFTYQDITIKYHSLEDFCDMLAEHTLKYQMVNKKSKDHIVFEKPNGGIYTIKTKQPIATLVQCYNESLLQNIEYYLGAEGILLNTNLKIENDRLLPNF
jgi:hypothetical protein